MEITPQALAELVASEVAKVTRADRKEPRQEAAAVMQTPLAVWAARPDEWTISFRRWTSFELGGQLVGYQKGQSAGFPSEIARRIIRAGAGVRIGIELDVRIPGSCRPGFREILAHHSGMMSPGIPI